jgi:hypothetical protein
MARPGGLELPTFWFVAVRTTLPNLARGVDNRTESESWGKFLQPAFSPSFIVICGAFAAVSCNLRYIFVTGSRSSRTRQGANPVEPAYSHILERVPPIANPGQVA